MLYLLVILGMTLSTCTAGRTQTTNQEIHLRATVQAVVPLTAFSGTVKPVDVDPRFVLTLRIESVVPVVANFSEGTVVAFSIHSPSLLFAGEPIKGNTYNFVLHREAENGKVRFFGLKIVSAPTPVHHSDSTS